MEDDIMRNVTKIMFLMLFVLLFASKIMATVPIEPEPIYADDPLMQMPVERGFGENHYYNVVFDGEGDAIVAARLDMTNIGKGSMESVELEIPGKSIRIVNIVQQVNERTKSCNRYEYDEEGNKKCNYWHERHTTKFYPVERNIFPLSKSTRVILDFEKAVTPQEQTSIIIYYKVNGYVTESFGISDFDFETIKLNQDINQIRVAVNVQEGLYLDGGEAKVDYLPSFGAMEAKASVDGMESSELSRFSNSITYARGYVKTAHGLDPYESFHVEGEYAKSWFALHSVGVLTAILVVVAVIVLIIFLVKRLLRAKFRNNRFSAVVLTGIVSGMLTLGTWVITAVVVGKLRHWIGHRYDTMLGLLLVLLATVVTIALLVVPPIFIGKRFGYKEGFAVVGITLLVLILLGIIITVGFAVFTQTGSIGGYF